MLYLKLYINFLYHNRSPCHQLELSEYAQPEGIKPGPGVFLANNPAYMPTEMSLKKSFSEDDNLSSKVLEEEHEYDYIAATFSSHQHDGHAAKKDVVPSSCYEIPIAKNW